MACTGPHIPDRSSARVAHAPFGGRYLPSDQVRGRAFVGYVLADDVFVDLPRRSFARGLNLRLDLQAQLETRGVARRIRLRQLPTDAHRMSDCLQGTVNVSGVSEP